MSVISVKLTEINTFNFNKISYSIPHIQYPSGLTLIFTAFSFLVSYLGFFKHCLKNRFAIPKLMIIVSKKLDITDTL